MVNYGVKVLFQKGFLKLLVFCRESLWWYVIFVNHHANGQWSFRFCTPLQAFSFLAPSVFFWAVVFESTFGRLLVENFSFRTLMIRPQGLLQTLSLLIDNSLLKTFLQRSTTRLDTIIISSYHLLCCNFLYVNFVYCLREKQPNKQINNQKISLCIT